MTFHCSCASYIHIIRNIADSFLRKENKDGDAFTHEFIRQFRLVKIYFGEYHVSMEHNECKCGKKIAKKYINFDRTGPLGQVKKNMFLVRMLAKKQGSGAFFFFVSQSKKAFK